MGHRREGIEVVLGAGGAKGPCLAGGYRALTERRVLVSKWTGTSIGSLAATAIANGASEDELEDLFVNNPLRHAIADEFNSLGTWVNPLRLATGLINLKPRFAKLIEERGWRPRPNLRIIAFNLMTAKPIVFEGTRYNLVDAIAGSCAIPWLMRPVWYTPPKGGPQKFVTRYAAQSMSRTGILVDGGVHHFHCTEFCKSPAIVFVLGTATQLPSELTTPIESYFHLLEMTAGRLIGVFQTDSCSPEDIVIPVGKPDVGGVSFSSSSKSCQQMVAYGYRIAGPALDLAIKQGRVPVSGRKRAA